MGEQAAKGGGAMGGGHMNIDREGEFDRLKSDIHTLREDLARLGKDVLTATRSASGAAGESARAEARKRLEQLSSAWDEAGARGRAVKHDVEQRIEEHPLAAVMIALGVGVLIGKLLDRR